VTRRIFCERCSELVDAQPKHVGEVIEWYCPIHSGKIAADISPKVYGDIREHTRYLKPLKRFSDIQQQQKKSEI